jgi:aspartyl-tRNA synthetase
VLTDAPSQVSDQQLKELSVRSTHVPKPSAG